jgi:predicted small lipoprotein YifL
VVNLSLILIVKSQFNPPRATTILLAVAMLAGCGQRGPLYLPKMPPPAPLSTATPLAPAAAPVAPKTLPAAPTNAPATAPTPVSQ